MVAVFYCNHISFYTLWQVSSGYAYTRLNVKFRFWVVSDKTGDSSVERKALHLSDLHKLRAAKGEHVKLTIAWVIRTYVPRAVNLSPEISRWLNLPTCIIFDRIHSGDIYLSLKIGYYCTYSWHIKIMGSDYFLIWCNLLFKDLDTVFKYPDTAGEQHHAYR